MRRLLLTIPACLLIAYSAPTARGADLPIPQNPARQEQAFRDLIDWNRRTLGGAYEKVGKKNSKWDKPAREALEAAARVAGKAIDPGAQAEDIFAPAKKAIEAGCDDPLILFLFARSSEVPNRPEPAELDRRWALAASAIERSNYPPLRRALALLGAGVVKATKEAPTPEDQKEAIRLFDVVLGLLPNAGAKEESNIEAEDEWVKLIRSLIKGYRFLDGNTRMSFNRVEPVLVKSASLKSIRLEIMARLLIGEAWEVRGNGLANSVTEAGGRTFEAKMIEAYKTLKQAWSINPKNYRTPTLMLSVMTALGGEREEMEIWFRRAMELKDSNEDACDEKLNYLDPKWHGSREEMMKFGDACKATKNWRGGITVVAARVHMRWTMQLDSVERVKYYQSPEVWEHGKSIYEEYLSHYTTDDVIRSEYAGFAYYCGRRDDAAKQFKILGDKIVGSMTYPLERLKEFKSSVETEARLKEQDRVRDAEKAKSKGQAGSAK